MAISTAKTKNKLLKLVGIAVFTALAYVVMVSIHFKVSFLTLDLKDAIITLCGLCFGPWAALFASIAVPLVEMITVSDTGVYGLFMNFMGTAAFSVTVSLIYRWEKSLTGALLGLVSGILAMTSVMMVCNLIVTPFYMHVTVADVQALIPSLLLPFNLIKAFLNAAIVMLLYKPISVALQKVGFLPPSKAKFRFDAKTIVAMVSAAVLVTVSLVIIFQVLGGSFQFGIPGK